MRTVCMWSVRLSPRAREQPHALHHSITAGLLLSSETTHAHGRLTILARHTPGAFPLQASRTHKVDILVVASVSFSVSSVSSTGVRATGLASCHLSSVGVVRVCVLV
jgi:hypothetical protein